MISDLYDSMVRAFRAYGCPAPIYLGKQFADQHTGPFRVVLWQDADTFGQANPSLPAAAQAATKQAINPRAVATRRCGVVANLWATAPVQRSAQDQYRADLAYLDALVNQVCVALQQLASGVFIMSAGMAAAGNDNADVAGLGYELRFSVDVPIIDAAWPAQQLSECTKTWIEAPATAEITIEKRVPPLDPPTYQGEPPFTVPTPEA